MSQFTLTRQPLSQQQVQPQQQPPSQQYGQLQQPSQNAQPFYPQLPGPAQGGQTVFSYGQPYGQSQQQYIAGPSSGFANQQQLQQGYQQNPAQQARGGKVYDPQTQQHRQHMYSTVPVGEQSVERVDPNEDKLYGPLGRARARVDRAIKADNEISPDIEAFGVDPTLGYLRNLEVGMNPVEQGRMSQLPEALIHQISIKDSTARMGIFEEIGRVWVTLNNQLYLWDYNHEHDFNRYDEQAEDITAVGLVKARPDVFIDDLQYLLVICTPTKISVLGLGSGPNSSISLFSTNLSASSPTPMDSVVGSSAGRIFMRGRDANVYELVYSNSSSFMSAGGPSLSIVNRSSSWIMGYMFIKQSAGVSDIVIDSERRVLYTLGPSNEIKRYDISGTAFEGKGSITKISPREAKVVALSPVGLSESQSRVLIAITSNGRRYYISDSAFNGSSYTTIPYRIFTESEVNFSRQSIYSSGTTIATEIVPGRENSGSRIHIFTPAIPTLLSRTYDNGVRITSAPLEEYYTVEECVHEVVQAVVEVRAGNPANVPRYQRNGNIALNPVVLETTRVFLVLTMAGIRRFVQHRPLDLLQSTLIANRDGYRVVRDSFGTCQIAAMGLELAITEDLAVKPTAASIVQVVLANAPEPETKGDPQNLLIKFSPRHDGLALTIARLLRPLWYNTVIARMPNGLFDLNIGERQLEQTQQSLSRLRQFLENEGRSLFVGHIVEGAHRKPAWVQEEMSINGLTRLVTQAIEAIAFVLLLKANKIHEVVARSDPEVQQALTNTTWAALLTNPSSRDLAKKLVMKLIELQIGQDAGIESLTNLLQERCGSFCQPGDIDLYKAEECLRRAEGSRAAYERTQNLADAFASYYRSASSIDLPRLQNVAKRFSDLGHVAGAIELPLHTAQAHDPHDRATEFLAAGRYDGDPRRAEYEERQKCYEIVIAELQKRDEALNEAVAAGNDSVAMPLRDEAYSLAIGSDDELFHSYLYDWHIKQGRAEQLLDYDTPFIETYLRDVAGAVPECRDLLWKFYQRREEYLAAAHALYELATSDHAIDLQTRAFYLAQAVTASKSAADVDAVDADFAAQLSELLDVSNVQVEIAQAISALKESEVSPDVKKDAIDRLNDKVLDIEILYRDFAAPFRLYEEILLIVKTADKSLPDVVATVWSTILQQAVGSPKHDAVAIKVVKLLQRFGDSEAAPLDVVVRLVYEQAGTLAPFGTPGWASKALSDGGVSPAICFETLQQLIEITGSEVLRQFYVEEASVLAELALLSGERGQDSIQTIDVENFVSAHVLHLSARELNEREREVKERLDRTKRALERR